MYEEEVQVVAATCTPRFNGSLKLFTTVILPKPDSVPHLHGGGPQQLLFYTGIVYGRLNSYLFPAFAPIFKELNWCKTNEHAYSVAMMPVREKFVCRQ
ncbi:MAG: hypothetical protein ACO1OO_05990 [Flavisolibacter sp.]